MIGSYRCRHVVILLFIASWTCHGKMTTTFLPRRVCSTLLSGKGFNSIWGNTNYSDYQLKLKSSSHSLVLTRIRGGNDNQGLPDLEEDDEDEEDEKEEEQEEDGKDEENKVDGEQQQDTVELSSEINTNVLGNDPQESLDEDNEDDEEQEDDYDEEEEASEEEEEGEEEEDRPTVQSTPKSSKQVESKQTFDEPFTLSAIQELVLTVGSMFLFNKLNLNDPKIIRLARFFFIGYIIAVQIFLIYVRIQAKAINDTTPITVTNPINTLLQSQLADKSISSTENTSSSSGTTNTMIKHIANSLLTSQTTIVEYDLSQAKSMNMSLLTPMLFLWFLHFKLGQVQPVFLQTLQGIKDLVISPLFQVYVWKRNLERPFRNGKTVESENGNEQQEEEVSSSNVQEGRKDKDNVSKVQSEEDDDDDEEEEDDDDEEKENGEKENEEEADEEDDATEENAEEEPEVDLDEEE